MNTNEDFGNSIMTIRHKIVVVGDINVGKTSVMNRFISNEFKEVYDPTIGVDFATKTIEYQENLLKLQIWDSAGQERYKSLIPSYVRGASIVFLVYDITKQESFDHIPTWLQFIKESNTDNAKLVLCGNKTDLTRIVKTTEGEAFAKQENMLFFEVSAKSSLGILNMFYSCIAELPFFEQFEIENKQKLIEELININSNNNTTKEQNSIYDIVKGKGEYTNSININNGNGNNQANANKQKKSKDKQNCNC